MSNYRRAHGGHSYFFTVVTHQRQRILLQENVRLALRAAIRHVRLTAPFDIMAFVLLPDHLHSIWRLPEGDTDYALRWNLIKGYVTRQCRATTENGAKLSWHRMKKQQGTLWQNRYWEHQIRNDLDFERHVDYIHFNPVKHGLVEQVSDWPYSSFHRFVAEGILPADWGGKDHDGKFGE